MELTATSLIKRISAFVDYLKRIEKQNDEMFSTSQVLAPDFLHKYTVNAANWTKTPPLCPECNGEMTYNLAETIHTKIGEYVCFPCLRLKTDERILALHKAKTANVYVPGELTRAVRETWREDARREAIAHLSTKKDLRDDRAAADLATLKRTPTNPLPARDIERANTDHPIYLAPTTPLPPTRHDLFADDDILSLGMTLEDDEDRTDKRLIVQVQKTTNRIPAITAEVLLEALMHSRVHEQSTGENERISSRQNEDAFLL